MYFCFRLSERRLIIMKRIISIFVTAVIAMSFCVAAFAADSAKFAVNVVSENDTKAVVSIDYEGGLAFNCLDFDVELSDRVSVTNCDSGAGLRNFKIYVGDLNTGGATVSNFNDQSNPIKFTFATTVAFKAENGKDLLTITLKKNSADKLTSKDVKLTVTNCGVSGSDSSTVTDIKSTAIQIGNEMGEVTAAAPGQAGTAAPKTTAASATTEVTTVNDGETTTAEDTKTDSEDRELTPETEETKKSTADKKKIVIIAALAAATLAVIVAAVVYIVHKTKNSTVE